MISRATFEAVVLSLCTRFRCWGTPKRGSHFIFTLALRHTVSRSLIGQLMQLLILHGLRAGPTFSHTREVSRCSCACSSHVSLLSGYQYKWKKSRSECLVQRGYVVWCLFHTIGFVPNTFFFTAGSWDDEWSKFIPRPQHSWRQCRLTLLWNESVLPVMLLFIPMHAGVF